MDLSTTSFLHHTTGLAVVILYLDKPGVVRKSKNLSIAIALISQLISGFFITYDESESSQGHRHVLLHSLAVARESQRLEVEQGKKEKRASFEKQKGRMVAGKE